MMIDMASYYDLVLGMIPLALGGGSLALFVAGVTLSTAIIAASLVAVLLIGHGMFVRTPVDDPSPVATPRSESFGAGAD